MKPALLVRQLGRVNYELTWRAMVDFSAQRSAETPDELWCCEHSPVYTLGQAGKPEHLLADVGIPLVKSDRGGQITYHGPGQVVIYLLLDLARRGVKVRELVTAIEQAVIALLAENGIAATRQNGAPGVYVAVMEKIAAKAGAGAVAEAGASSQLAKVAALGLRVRKGCCYHGVSLNVDMDMSPFAAINPCGYPGLRVTQMRDLGAALTLAQAAEALAKHLNNQLELLGTHA